MTEQLDQVLWLFPYLWDVFVCALVLSIITLAYLYWIHTRTD
jgi:hypothetical protein